ncbi:MAG: hypothetical protein IKL62_02940 [Clostridia bacterium]|nr:hypothetical protein [Clostridia bacterium]
MNKSTYVTVNGTKIANLLEVKLNIERDFEVTNGKLSTTNTAPVVTIRRAQYPSGNSDGIEIRTLSNFTLEIHTGMSISKLTGCEWIAFDETLEQNRTIESIKIAAPSYSFSK